MMLLACCCCCECFGGPCGGGFIPVSVDGSADRSGLARYYIRITSCVHVDKIFFLGHVYCRFTRGTTTYKAWALAKPSARGRKAEEEGGDGMRWQK